MTLKVIHFFVINSIPRDNRINSVMDFLSYQNYKAGGTDHPVSGVDAVGTIIIFAFFGTNNL